MEDVGGREGVDAGRIPYYGFSVGKWDETEAIWSLTIAPVETGGFEAGRNSGCIEASLHDVVEGRMAREPAGAAPATQRVEASGVNCTAAAARVGLAHGKSEALGDSNPRCLVVEKSSGRGRGNGLEPRAASWMGGSGKAGETMLVQRGQEISRNSLRKYRVPFALRGEVFRAFVDIAR